MSDNIDPTELLGQVQDENVRAQLAKAFDALSGSALRKQVDTLNDEVKAYKSRERTRAFTDAGFDPESGPGKALAKLYEGEPDPEKIREVAQEYGLNPTAPAGGEAQASAPDPNAARQAGEDRLAALNAGSSAPRDPSANDRIAQAEASGDVATADRLRAEILANL